MKKKYPIQFEVKIEDYAAEGKALTHIDDKICFVPYAAPGDVVDLQITNKRKRFLEAKVVRYHSYSEERVEPVCEHFALCGGCKWQHIPYETQLKIKQQTVIDHLQRIGHLTLPELMPILGAETPFLYRNKLEYTFSNRRWLTEAERSVAVVENFNALGFHIPGTFDKVLDIHQCHLQKEPTNAIRLFVKDYVDKNKLTYYDVKTHEGLMRNLIVRSTERGEWMLILVFGFDDPAIHPLLEAVAQQFPQVNSLQYVVNEKWNDSIGDLPVHLFKGDAYITEAMQAYAADAQPLLFRIGPQSFYQTNSRQAERLYRVVADFCALKGDEIVYDLYTGAGTIAQYVADKAQKVVGIEYVPSAIADAKINAQQNHINNAFFYAGDMAAVLNAEFVAQNGRPSVVITDPPRAGMHDKVIEQLLEIMPDKIVYVSCNSATQARDISLLQPHYSLRRMQTVDMFPQTHHVENVILLERNC